MVPQGGRATASPTASTISAILYARGIGVEQPTSPESYKWFALAAPQGDQDAAGKRDEVAARLDQQTLVAAKLAVQTFAAEREPEEATNLKAPPGGWDAARPRAGQAERKRPPRQPERRLLRQRAIE